MPGLLKQGDLVDLVAPASACSKEEYEKAVLFIEKEFGLNVRARKYEDLVDESEVFCSNTDEYRFSHLWEALAAVDSKAVWCLKGGYGSPRLFEYFRGKKKLPEKLFIGFSDITAIQSFFIKEWNWQVLQAPMPVQMALGKVNKASIDTLKKLLFKNSSYEINLKCLGGSDKKAKGELIGGCLSLVQTLLGTKQELDFKGKILFLEDVGESGARVDRMFNHLYRAGVFKKLEAILLGNFLLENDKGKPAEIEIKKAIDNLLKITGDKIPVYECKKLGHTSDMLPLHLGVKAVIKDNILKVKL